jgi:hypothetical protein
LMTVVVEVDEILKVCHNHGMKLSEFHIIDHVWRMMPKKPSSRRYVVWFGEHVYDLQLIYSPCR